MTQREFYSDISSMIKAENLTDWISPRFVIHEAKSIVGDYLKKDHDAKKHLARLSEGWFTLPCVKLTEVPVSTCTDVDANLCQKLMKSINRLPDTYSYSYGDIIKSVGSVNMSNFYDPVTPRQWNSIQKREYVNKNKYYYFFRDGYLFIPIPNKSVLAVEDVIVEAYFKDQYECYLFNNEVDNCQYCPPTQNNDCAKPLDFEFVCPYYLENAVKNELNQKLAKIFRAIKESTNPDLSGDINNQRLLQNDKNGLTS